MYRYVTQSTKESLKVRLKVQYAAYCIVNHLAASCIGLPFSALKKRKDNFHIANNRFK